MSSYVHMCVCARPCVCLTCSGIFAGELIPKSIIPLRARWLGIYLLVFLVCVAVIEPERGRLFLSHGFEGEFSFFFCVLRESVGVRVL